MIRPGLIPKTEVVQAGRTALRATAVFGLIAFVLSAAAAPPSSADSHFVVQLVDNRFEMEQISTKEYHFTNKQTGFVYTLDIWDDLSRQGVALYCQQGLQIMPNIWKDRGFKLLHKEGNPKYVGFTYLLDDEWHMEYLRNIGARSGIRVSTKGSRAESLSRLHDVLFIINNVRVIKAAETRPAEQK